jgi:hypothetical protein
MGHIPNWTTRLNPKITDKAISHRHTFKLPFGYTATFSFPSGEIYCDPDFPRIRKPRAWRKFFDAYKAARRSFFEEVAAVMGGRVMIVDTADLETVLGTDIIRPPVRH